MASWVGPRLRRIRAVFDHVLRLVWPGAPPAAISASWSSTHERVRRREPSLIRAPSKEPIAGLDRERYRPAHRCTIVDLAEDASATRDLEGRVSVALRARPENVAVSRAFAHRYRRR